MQDEIRIEYKGKIYTRLEDFAKQNGGVTRTIKNRWYRGGYRDPKELLQEGKLPRKFHGVHTLVYQGIEYPSLKEFCRFFDLNYRKALTLWKRKVRNPQIIRDQASFQDNQEVLEDVRTNDLSNVEKLVNSYGYLTSWQVAEKTGISGKKIREQVARLLANQNNNMGVQKDDIHKMEYSVQERAKLTKNGEVLSKYAFKPQVVEHIKQHLNQVNKDTVKLIPFFNDKYYFDEETEKVLSKRKSNNVLKEISLHDNVYTLRDDSGKRFGFTIETIKDLIANPNIKAEDLMTKSEIIKKYGLTPAIWNNRKIFSILPVKIGHTRYSKTGKSVRGWTKDTVDQAVKAYPEKFKPKKDPQ